MCETRRRRSILTLWLPVNLPEHALVPVSGLVDTLREVAGSSGWRREGVQKVNISLELHCLDLMWA